MDKREFVQLAQKYRDDISPAGMMVSEKLDGERVLWDGGMTTGLLAQDIPFANTLKDKKPVISTGLWTRGGKVIWAPKWFTDKLPKRLLDGEGWGGRGNFQGNQSVMRSEKPNDPRWKTVQFKVFDSPSITAFGRIGRIHTPNWEVEFHANVLQFLLKRQSITGVESLPEDTQFYRFYELAQEWGIDLLEQETMPLNTLKAKEVLRRKLDEITLAGGEGLILRRYNSTWNPIRSWDVLKVKKLDDEEGIVVGYKFGNETEKDSKHQGKCGSLVVQNDRGVFGVGGLNDSERMFQGEERYKYAFAHPGEDAPSEYILEAYPIGCEITFTYIGLTDKGLPKHANVLRKR